MPHSPDWRNTPAASTGNGNQELGIAWNNLNTHKQAD